MKSFRTFMTRFAFAILLPSSCLTNVHADQQDTRRILWYNKPAQNWAKEALPLGNGRLGCMVFGRVAVEDGKIEPERFTPRLNAF